MSRTTLDVEAYTKVKVAVNEAQKSAKRLIQGRTQVVFYKPLFAPLIFKLEPKQADWLPTMATDGRSLMYNPKFVLDMSVDHLKFGILHEVLHCAMNHPGRRGSRDPQVWNIASDMVVNGILVFEEGMNHPSWIILDKKYHGMTAEAIYDDLMKNAEKTKEKYPVPCPCVQKDPTAGDDDGEGQGQNDGEKEGKGSGGDPTDGNSQNGNQPVDPKGWRDVDWDRNKQEEWKQAVNQSDQMARQQGTAPGWFKSLVDEINEPRIPVEKMLQHILGDKVSDETTWRSPNRRFVSRGLYLPTTLKDKKDGVVVLDTSGSVDDETAKHFLGLLMRVLRSKGINEIRFMQADTRVVDDVTFKNVTEFKSHIKREGVKGRSGTCFREPFERIQDEGKEWNTSFLIYLTDLAGTFPEKKPRYPVIWISVDRDKAPFGTTYHWDVKNHKIDIVR